MSQTGVSDLTLETNESGFLMYHPGVSSSTIPLSSASEAKEVAEPSLPDRPSLKENPLGCP